MKRHIIVQARDVVVARELFPAWKILRKILSYSVSRKGSFYGFKIYILLRECDLEDGNIDRDIDGTRHGLLIHV